MSATLVRPAAILAILTAVVVWSPRTRAAGEPEHLIVKCQRPCSGVVAAVSALGGEVTYAYENVDAVAVVVPVDRVVALSANVGADAVRKDVTVERPAPVQPVEVESTGAVQTIGEETLAGYVGTLPANYNYNNALTGAASLHANGLLGQNVIVAVIDTGVQIAASPLGPAVGGTVIGGENLIPLATDPVASATSRLNDWHGTSVSEMIAAHVNFVFQNTSTLVRSLRVHSPASVIACPGPPFDASCPQTASIVPMIGTAPAAKVYALKVFPSQGGGAPVSRVIAAMDRVLTLRRNFDNGASTGSVSGTGTENDPYRYNALNIRVVNMSLGGATTFAGQDIEDELTEALRDAGIVVASAAGNIGFGAMTVESPATGFGSLAVAAADTPVHERVLRDSQFGFGIGIQYRPYNNVQTAFFSSRGPNANGDTGPDLIANGFGSYTSAFAAVSSTGALVSCGATNAVPLSCFQRILLVSGTSFATPTVAGAAALLRGAVPQASAAAVRKSLIKGADPNVLGDGSGPFDQGAGFLDVPSSLTVLTSHNLDDDECDDDHGHHDRDGHGDGHCRGRGHHGSHEDGPDEVGAGGSSVIQNVKRAGASVVSFKKDQYQRSVQNLLPGEVEQFFIPVDDQTDRLTVKVSGISSPGPQNALFGNDLVTTGLDAPTSVNVERFFEFINVDTTYVIDNPQTGLFRFAIQGDWTNAAPISAQVSITRERSRLDRATARGEVEQGDLIPIEVTVPPGVSQAVFELFWRQNWGRYPTNDIDMFLVRPDSTIVFTGATLSSPERVVVNIPLPGVWTVLVSGFAVHDTSKGPHTGEDHFTLRVSADGTPILIK
jgi:hypothetical protein